MKKFRVYMHSQSGMWEHYSGYVDVFAYDTDKAIAEAKDKLKRGSFPDRPRDSWMIERIETLPN